MYCSYIDYVRPYELKEKEDMYREENEQMTQQLEAQAQEFESCKNVCDMYLAKEAGYKSEIVDLSSKVAELEQRLKNETSKLRQQL